MRQPLVSNLAHRAPGDAVAAVRLHRVSKRYGHGEAAVAALHEVSLAVAPGEFLALMGRSGCGKTTLLNLAGAMDVPTSGEVHIAGRETSRLDDDQLTRLRARTVGFVFQAFHLLPALSVRENVELQLLLRGGELAANGRDERVARVLDQVSLGGKAGAFPHQLSGGEMQRVAIARALVHRPELIIADEPTGNLDSQTSAVVLDLLENLSREAGVAVIMATHSPEAARRAGRVVYLRDGDIDAGDGGR